MALTKHPEGSLKELWGIAFPLMLSSLSVMMMLFVDRLLLAHYSTAALNAAVNSTTLGWAFVFSWVVMTSISEVFVAQYNGAGRKEKLGEPVWQMIWFSLCSILFFAPLAYWGDVFFFGDSYETILERDYFRIMMIFGPSFPIYSALCGFFVGQGKTFLITILAVAANLVNVIFDIILIFGIEEWVPSLGVKGAAIATSASTIFQVAILFYFFLTQENKKTYGTANYHLKKNLLYQCIKMGLPGGIFVGIEVLGFAAFYSMMNLLGEKYITVVGITQSVCILFYFFAEGINKAVTTISGNLIGSQKADIIPKVLISGLKLHFYFFLILGACLFLGADFLIDQFLPNASIEWIDSVRDTILVCLFGILFYLLFEGVRLLFAGILTASGDTLFLLIAGSLSVWILLVLPVYVIVVKGGARVEFATFICVFYSMGASLLYAWRFLKNKSQTRSITI